MQPKNRISVGNIFPIFGLVVLLCLAPCSIRNLIQHELESSLTKFFNKNQTTISSATCSLSEVNTVVASNKFSKHFPLNLFELDSNSSPFPPVYTALVDTTYRAWHSRVTPVPYYILYKNFKDYL